MGRKRGVGVYHDESSTAGRVIGRPEILRSRPELAPLWDRAARLFPVQVTRSFWNRIQGADEPERLARQVLPGPEELLPAEGDLDDPVGDAARSPVPWVVHKYPNRVLLLLTKRCHLYCRYCFRRAFEPGERTDPTPEELDAALDYAIHSGAREVILSGGDPLALSDGALGAVLERLTAGGIDRIRVHTRAPITAPHRVTPALVERLASVGSLWVVVHANHVNELSEEVARGLALMVDGGIPVSNQAVLLRGVNDDAGILAELFETLVQHRVRPYYLHHTDAVTGNAAFRVPLEEGIALYDQVRSMVSGLALPRYVIDPPDGGGKVDVERWVAAGAQR